MTRNYHAETAGSITALGKRIIANNLCKEIMLSPPQLCILGYPKTTESLRRLMPKYNFSRTKWYVAEFAVQDYTDVAQWCKEQFGPHPRYPDAWSRWVHTYEDRIHFRDARDYEWFMLRWSA